MSDTPPLGIYQAGGMSPDQSQAANGDPRIMAWLTDHNIDPSETYRVNLFSLGAWVHRYAVDEHGHVYRGIILDDEGERRLPLWVWE